MKRRSSTVTRRTFVRTGLLAAAAGLCRCPAPSGGSQNSGEEPFDLCVVGSGFAGTYLALRATAGGMRTALVEAAPMTGLDALGDAFAITNSGGTAYPANRTRLIALGGTSNLWSGVVNRLRPSDFRMRSEFDMEVDWPIAYDDLAPFYCEAEQALAATGDAPVPDAEPPRSCDYPFTPLTPPDVPRLEIDDRRADFFRVSRSAREGTGGPVRVAQSEIETLQSTAGATLKTGLQAMDLATADGRTIDALVARTTDGREQRIRARVFVVAAGVLESARLLLFSRSSSHPAGLGNDHDLVGRYFVEHPTYLFRFQGDRPTLPPGAYRTYTMNDRFRSEGLNACHFQVHVGSSGDVVCKAQPELQARPENRIALSNNHDRFGAPLTDVHFDLSERDNRTTAAGMKALEKLAAELGHRGPLQPEKIWRAHPAGTCRMGFNETDGVVDRDGKVFGTSNLFVSGATVFPTAGTSNPTLTVVAMTMRLGDHLLSRFG